MKNENEIEQLAVVATPDFTQQNMLAEIDQQVATAKKYPRNINRFRSNVIAEATINQATIESMMYAMPVGDGKIETGPSIRMAEIVGSQYGNLMVQGRIISINEKTVTAQGVAWDMETNFKVSVEVSESIIKKDGTRYKERMIKNVCNSAISKAYRNAIFRVVPKSTVNWFIEQLEKSVQYKPEEVEEKKLSAFKYLKDKFNIPEINILNFVGKKTIAEIGTKELTKIRAGLNAIKDGQASPFAVFENPEKEESEKEEKKNPVDELFNK